MDSDLQLRAAIYRHFVDHATAPSVDAIAQGLGWSRDNVREGYQRLGTKRMIVLMPDGESIRMALPFSGVETQHRVRANGKTYFANCAWDAFGVPAALHADAEVISRCEQTNEPLRFHLTSDGPPESTWRFHAVVPAAQWWRDIVYT